VVSPGQVFSQEVERQSQKEEKRKRIQEKVETSATNDERKSTSLGLDSLESNGNQIRSSVALYFYLKDVARRTLALALIILCTLCSRYRDSPVNGDPTSVLVNGTPRYLDKKNILSG